MATMKTPGVYIVEKNAFPNSVVEVPTAVPAFIGYTEKAVNGVELLTGKPWKISSMAEYQNYFGGAPVPVFTLAKESATPTPEDKKKGEEVSPDNVIKLTMPLGEKYNLTLKEGNYTLYYNMLLFFANGGGPCYIVSVGDYATGLEADKLLGGITPLLKESEPTMLVIPEAVNLKVEDCIKVQQAMLKHCGLDTQSRFAILDVHSNKYVDQSRTCVETFREQIGSNQMNYGAAYYPWLLTSVLSDNDILFDNVDAESLQAIVATWKDAEDKPTPLSSFITKEFAEISAGNNVEQHKKNIHQALLQNWPAYSLIIKTIKENLNLLPPSSAMAGLYTMVDNTRGVWKAPANISVNNVVKPSVNISHAEQEELNVPMSGKAINAIRAFQGEGIKVWGARTLDGNSLDWRYINVRRTMIYLEQSVKSAARAYVFEPNDAGTWLNMKCMIENFLRSVWKRGGLAGSTPEDAYEVHVGLGDTMTPEDILEGIMRVTVLVAVSRPAEFIEITFQQQMQKS